MLKRPVRLENLVLWHQTPEGRFSGPVRVRGAMGLKIEISPNLLKTQAEGPLRKAAAEWRG